MALNFSHRPIFPAHLSEDNFVSPMSISSGLIVDGVSEGNSDVYGMSWLINRELVDCLDFLEDSCEGRSSRDCVPGDVRDLLPSDPFGMDMSTTFTAITGWLHDLNVDYGDGGGYGRDERVSFDENYELFAGLNYIWNNAYRFQSFPFGNEGVFDNWGELGGFGAWSDGRQEGGLSCYTDPQSLYVLGTMQTLGMEPEISEWGFGAWSGGLSCHTDPQTSYGLGTMQTRIEPETSGGGFSVWSDGRRTGGFSCHTDDPQSSYVADTIQTLGIEPEISGRGFGVWSDRRSAGGLSCHTDPDLPYVVDTIQTLGIEPEISGWGFTWSDGRSASCVSCHTDLESLFVVDTFQTLGIEPETTGGCFGSWSDEQKLGGMSIHTDIESPYVVDTILHTLGTDPETSAVQPVVHQEGNHVSSDAGEPPHAALNFVLGYLGTQELLVVESVCKSLQSTAEGDPFFWRNINIRGKPDAKITDDILFKLTIKAQGGLESLSLANCVKISDEGLNKVLLNNPKITKLCVPGCTRLTIGGIVDNLKAFKSKSKPGLKYLSIAGMYGVSEANVKELEKLLLDTDNSIQLITREPRFYRGAVYFPSCDIGRAIDIERCPKCTNMRIVYDCPVVGCKGIKEGDTSPRTHAQRCRGCTLCVARCNWCGRCIDETEHEETFCLDLRCIDCGKQISKCE